MVRRFLAGPHGFFALPKRYRKMLAALAVDEEVDPFKPIQLPGLWQDLLLSNTDSFVYQLGRTLIGNIRANIVLILLPPPAFPGRASSSSSTMISKPENPPSTGLPPVGPGRSGLYHAGPITT